jgi:hypothetical protein
MNSKNYRETQAPRLCKSGPPSLTFAQTPPPMSISATANTRKTFISGTPCWSHKPRSRESFHSPQRRRESKVRKADAIAGCGRAAGISFSLGGGFRSPEGCQRATLNARYSSGFTPEAAGASQRNTVARPRYVVRI